MVIERELLPFTQWLLPSDGSLGALLSFVIIVAILGFLTLVVSFLVLTVRHGPMKAGDKTYRVVSTGLRELFQLSPRRIWALARLSVQEAIRKRVIVGLILFVVVLLFASWFMRTDYKEPGRLFISFVTIASTYLVLGVALLVSAFSLPSDIKAKTIHTVVTKPVRTSEIVVGRILGFVIVGTVLLLFMGAASYFFVVRSLYHTHVVDVTSIEPILGPDGTPVGKQGSTSISANHHHSVQQDPSGEWSVTPNNSHNHSINEDSASEAGAITLGGPEGFMRARVPKYGTLGFKDRQGGDKDRGISVGNEWTYRSFIDGRTAAAAIWTFDGIRADDHPDGLDLELIVRVFRSHKGIIVQGIHGEIYLRNPQTSAQSKSEIFTAKDDTIDKRFFARKLKDTNDKEVDLFDDLISEDGRIEVWVKCLDPGQYFGFAQADCYLHLADASPFWNFWKAYISIWLQMVLVVAIGVACSTLVSGPIAALFTVGLILLGFNKASFLEIALGNNYGGGPVESLVRLVTQANMITPLEEGIGTTIVQSLDTVIRWIMWAIAHVLPDFPRFNTTNYVAEGFNIPANQVEQDLVVCLAYVAGLIIIGSFFLRTREVVK